MEAPNSEWLGDSDAFEEPLLDRDQMPLPPAGAPLGGSEPPISPLAGKANQERLSGLPDDVVEHSAGTMESPMGSLGNPVGPPGKRGDVRGDASLLDTPASSLGKRDDLWGKPGGSLSAPGGSLDAPGRSLERPDGPLGKSDLPSPPDPLADEAVDDEDEEPEGLLNLAMNAPPWLASMVFHMLLLIVGGLLAVKVIQAEKVDVQANLPEPKYAEKLGDELGPIDSSDLSTSDKDVETAEKPSITPQNLPRVDEPFAAPERLTDLAPDGNLASSDIEAPEIGMALSGRMHGSSKNFLLRAYGGTATTEDAVIKGLEWLAKNQRYDGSWSLRGPYKDAGSEENAVSATAMALLAFQGQGNTHQSGRFSENVKKGWAFLLKLQDKEGDFFKSGPPQHRLYSQAQATIALCELYGMTNDSHYREPAERAVNYAVRIQDKEGGWRYTPGSESDMSVTGWFVMALQSARMAKLDVPTATLDNITRFLDSVEEKQEYNISLYAYQPKSHKTLALTAEALLCRQYLGSKQDDPKLIHSIGMLNEHRVNYDDQNVYYWYYATQAAHHMEGAIWNKWNEVMRQQVPAHQVKNGPESGSWNPSGDQWGSQGGRLYVTCLSIYMLEVYYRHLPIYSGYKFFPAK